MKKSTLWLACMTACASALAQPDVLLADASHATELPDVVIISTSPLGTSGISLKQYPGNVQTINYADIPKDANNVAEVLQSASSSITLNYTQGNPYQMDLSYRGFSASPVLGTPQGISVFMDGMRVNEPFGDVVSWDLIPQIAIANMTLIPGSNPVYGLNTLGGALSMNTKSGFQFSGTQAKGGMGSFGRMSMDVETGGHGEDTDYYIAGSALHDNGWAHYNPSTVQQFFSKFGFQDDVRDIDFSFMYADNSLYGNQTVPLSMLNDAASGYSHPDYTKTQSYAFNLKSTWALSRMDELAGNVYYRHIERNILNSNINDTVSPGDNSCASNPTSCTASNILTNYTQSIYGLNLQSNHTGLWLDRARNLTFGINYEHATTSLNNLGQNAYLDNTRAVVGVENFSNQGNVNSVNRRFGVYATQTSQATSLLAVTTSARWDWAAINLAGATCSDSSTRSQLCNPASNSSAWTSVDGVNTYHRLNPSIGATYQLSEKTTSFINYSEGFRTPNAIELACSDASKPCSNLPNAFSADPPLQPVISKTWEAGLRNDSHSALRWKGAFFLSHLYNDIYLNQVNSTQGYFSNIGQTQREGLEFSLQGQSDRYDYAASLTYVNATFQSSFTPANTNNSNCTVNGPCTLVQPGAKMPSIPALTLKVNLGYKPAEHTHIGMLMIAQGPQYARGDENNTDINGQVPGFATIKLHANHELTKDTELIGTVNNVLNTQYANFGVLATNNINIGQSEQFRSIGAPRSWYAGLRMKF